MDAQPILGDSDEMRANVQKFGLPKPLPKCGVPWGKTAVKMNSQTTSVTNKLGPCALNACMAQEEASLNTKHVITATHGFGGRSPQRLIAIVGVLAAVLFLVDKIWPACTKEDKDKGDCPQDDIKQFAWIAFAFALIYWIIDVRSYVQFTAINTPDNMIRADGPNDDGGATVDAFREPCSVALHASRGLKAGKADSGNIFNRTVFCCGCVPDGSHAVEVGDHDIEGSIRNGCFNLGPFVGASHTRFLVHDVAWTHYSRAGREAAILVLGVIFSVLLGAAILGHEKDTKEGDDMTCGDDDDIVLRCATTVSWMVGVLIAAVFATVWWKWPVPTMEFALADGNTYTFRIPDGKESGILDALQSRQLGRPASSSTVKSWGELHKPGAACNNLKLTSDYVEVVKEGQGCTKHCAKYDSWRANLRDIDYVYAAIKPIPAIFWFTVFLTVLLIGIAKSGEIDDKDTCDNLTYAGLGIFVIGMIIWLKVRVGGIEVGVVPQQLNPNTWKMSTPLFIPFTPAAGETCEAICKAIREQQVVGQTHVRQYV